MTLLIGDVTSGLLWSTLEIWPEIEEEFEEVDVVDDDEVVGVDDDEGQ